MVIPEDPPEVDLGWIVRRKPQVDPPPKPPKPPKPPAGPTPSLRDELFAIRTRCERSLRLLMGGIDQVLIEDTRRTFVLIDKSAKAAMAILDAEDDR